MGLEAIQEEILEETSHIGAMQIEEARKKAEAIKEDTRKLIEEENRKNEAEIESLIAQIKSAIEAKAKFEIKKLELNSKKEIIDQIFKKAEEKIRSLDPKIEEGLIKTLLADAKSEIDVATILCNEKTKRYMPSNMHVKVTGMAGGLIAENKDGTIRVDNRFETILAEVRKNALKNIAKSIL